MNDQAQRFEAVFRRSLALLVVCWCGIVEAQVPHVLNYQGYLTNPGGTPVNVPVVMTFRLYAAASGGVALYTEIQPSVSVANGIFNAVIGSATPLALPFDVPYWLTVTINADGEMSPRQEVTASAYAIRSANAESLAPAATVDGAQITGAIVTGTLPTGNLTGTVGTAQIADNAVATAKLADGAVTQPKLSASGGTAGQMLSTDGSNLQWANVPAATNAWLSGYGSDPTGSIAFLSVTVNLTVGANANVHVSANKAFGSVAAGGASGLFIFPCYQNTVLGSSIVTIGADIAGLQVPQNSRMVAGITGIAGPLAAGTYKFGMCGASVPTPANWNSNEYSYVSVFVLN